MHILRRCRYIGRDTVTVEPNRFGMEWKKTVAYCDVTHQLRQLSPPRRPDISKFYAPILHQRIKRYRIFSLLFFGSKLSVSLSGKCKFLPLKTCNLLTSILNIFLNFVTSFIKFLLDCFSVLAFFFPPH